MPYLLLRGLAAGFGQFWANKSRIWDGLSFCGAACGRMGGEGGKRRKTDLRRSGRMHILHLMEEALWIAALRKREQAAYARLVERYQSRIYNVCLGFVFHREEAEDLCQEVFVEVYRSIEQFEGRASIGTWMHRIAVTKSLEAIRARGRKKRAAQLLSLIGLKEAGIEPQAYALDHPGIQLENQERARHLYAAIDHLPENQRVAFTLAKVEGRSYEEVAEIMQVSIPSVESLLFRARRTLQALLENFYRHHL